MRRAFSVSAYARYADRVMLVNHFKQKAWVPIGGEIEAGETPLEALIREVREEVGWELDSEYTLRQLPKLGHLDIPPLPGFLCYEEHDAGPKGLHMNFAFILQARTQLVSECDEFHEIAWVTRSDARSPVPTNVALIVDQILERY